MSNYAGPPPRLLADDWELLLRQRLPYGLWVLSDGCNVLFNRNYKPMLVRQSLATSVTVANPEWWVPWEIQRWFFSDADAPWRARYKSYTRAKRAACVGARMRAETVLRFFNAGLELPDEVFEREKGKK